MFTGKDAPCPHCGQRQHLHRPQREYLASGPLFDGFATCRALRRLSTVPVIMVTARSDTPDIVAGLEAGADDYVTKPFVAKELAARIRALLRRSRAEDGTAVLPFGDVEIEPDAGVVRRAGEEIHCTRTEFRLLCELANHPGKVLSREHLLERVWGYDYFGDGRLVDVHVRAGSAPRSTRSGHSPIHPDRPRYGLQAGGPRRCRPDVDRARQNCTGTPRARRTHLSGRLGLRARVTLTFALAAFGLSALMAGITYFTARATFLSERQAAEQRQAFANATLIQNALRSPATDVTQLVESVDTIPGSRSVLRTDGQWYATSISVGQSAIPPTERALVLTGTRPPSCSPWPASPRPSSASLCPRCMPPTSRSSPSTSSPAPCARWRSPWPAPPW